MSDFDLLWNVDLHKQLQIICSSKEDSNVTIWLGKDRKIAAHKFVLDASSKFMEVECSDYNQTNRMYNVILSPEFSRIILILLMLLFLAFTQELLLLVTSMLRNYCTSLLKFTL